VTIGQKITINGVGWEEISRKEYDNIPSENTASFNFNDYYEEKYYKKVEQQVFPKVFEGDTIKMTITKEKYIILENKFKLRDVALTLKDIIIIEQALAFRDDLLRSKK